MTTGQQVSISPILLGVVVGSTVVYVHYLQVDYLLKIVIGSIIILSIIGLLAWFENGLGYLFAAATTGSVFGLGILSRMSQLNSKNG